MTPERDLHDEMHRWPIDDDTADRLLAGRVDPKDAPPGYDGVARLVRTARGPALPSELGREASIVSAAVAALAPSSPSRSKEIPMRKKLVPFKLAAASVAGVVGFATAAAAVGVDLASHSSHAGSHAVVQFSSSSHRANGSSASTAGSAVSGSGGSGATGGTGSTGATGATAGATTTPSGPVTGMTNGHATFGLCTAFLAIYRTGAGATSSALTSTAFKALATHLQTTTAAATAAKCTTFVTKTAPGAAASTHTGVTPASHPSGSANAPTITHPSATTHPSARSHPGA